MTEETVQPPVETVALEEVPTRQIGFLTKGGGMNIDAWVALDRAKFPDLIVKDFPNHVEIHLPIVEKKKKT